MGPYVKIRVPGFGTVNICAIKQYTVEGVEIRFHVREEAYTDAHAILRSLTGFQLSQIVKEMK